MTYAFIILTEGSQKDNFCIPLNVEPSGNSQLWSFSSPSVFSWYTVGATGAKTAFTTRLSTLRIPIWPRNFRLSAMKRQTPNHINTEGSFVTYWSWIPPVRGNIDTDGGNRLHWPFIHSWNLSFYHSACSPYFPPSPVFLFTFAVLSSHSYSTISWRWCLWKTVPLPLLAVQLHTCFLYVVMWPLSFQEKFSLVAEWKTGLLGTNL